MVRGWREEVWRNAERLLNARGDAECQLDRRRLPPGL
jgi:hypothetical protein